MLLGFISLLLTATSSIISNICIPSRFYNSLFAPCTKSDVDEEMEGNKRKLLMNFVYPHRRVLNVLNLNTCQKVSHVNVQSLLLVSFFYMLIN